MTATLFERAQTGRMRLHVMPTKRFKTFAISLYAGVPLAESSVTTTALTPFVLRRGTQATPETLAFRERLDNLYGAGFGFDIYKRGDAQIVQFRMDVINDQFVSSGTPLLAAALKLLGEIVTDPALEDGVFRGKYVAAEKMTLQKRLEAIINDKIRYAAERCLAEMCRNEPYRLHALGKLDDLPGISSESLYDAYRGWLGQAELDLYVAGDTTLAEVEQLAAEAFRLEPSAGAGAGYARSEVGQAAEEPRTVIETLDVSQGKLNMGLRTHIGYADEAYPALLMYNGILGGYPHSKLFLNVREKASLAYYAASRLDGHKGICTIQSGIEIANFEQAKTIILAQLQSMKEGQISELELSQTRAMISNQLREMQDSAFEMISYDFNSVLSGKSRTAAELISAIEAADVEQIVQVADKVELDTIYFLRGKEAQLA